MSKKPNGYWAYERCKEKALEYKSRSELRKNNSSVYCLIIENKWNELLDHMINNNKSASNRKSKGYWTYERCRKESLKYKTKKELRKNCYTVYDLILKKSRKNKKWLDLCSHMELLGNRFKRLIYVYEFSDNSCYVGLTGDIKRRKLQHTTYVKSSVYKHSKVTNLIPICVIKSDYIDVKDASLLEGYIKEEYRIDGWNILNIVKTGNVGGSNTKWTYNKCKEESIKYKKRVDFQKNNPSAYQSSRKNGWLDDICSHMIIPPLYSFETCTTEAKKYKSRWEFYKKSNKIYSYSLNHDILDVICSHMIPKYELLNIETCQVESIKYKTRYDFYKSSNRIYNFARKNKWLDLICTHMPKRQKTKLNN